MKYPAIFIPSAFLLLSITACDANREAANSIETEGAVAGGVSAQTAPEFDSFRIGNKEIRDEMMELFEENDIPFTLNEDNSIRYRLADGDQIDLIYTDVRLAYIRRN